MEELFWRKKFIFYKVTVIKKFAAALLHSRKRDKLRHATKNRKTFNFQNDNNIEQLWYNQQPQLGNEIKYFRAFKLLLHGITKVCFARDSKFEKTQGRGYGGSVPVIFQIKGTK